MRRGSTHQKLLDKVLRNGVEAFWEGELESLDLLEGKVLGSSSEGRNSGEELEEDASNGPEVRAERGGREGQLASLGGIGGRITLTIP